MFIFELSGKWNLPLLIDAESVVWFRLGVDSTNDL